MASNHSIDFFETQFQKQARSQAYQLNPFESEVLPYLHGRVLDYGCGMGNLAIEAAKRGCSVVALDASPSAIADLQQRASSERLPVEAEVADLRYYQLKESFDSVVSIGLLMFFDCPTAFKALAHLQAHVSEGGLAVVNVLVEGTTYLDMFDADHHCLFNRPEIESRFAGWHILKSEFKDFDAPNGKVKSFATVIARKPVTLHA
ncbi:MAG: class I SAM-dependent methyltransferase [Burkholderiales bacterium]